MFTQGLVRCREAYGCWLHAYRVTEDNCHYEYALLFRTCFDRAGPSKSSFGMNTVCYPILLVALVQPYSGQQFADSPPLGDATAHVIVLPPACKLPTLKLADLNQDIVILGAGFSGLLIGIKLKEDWVQGLTFGVCMLFLAKGGILNDDAGGSYALETCQNSLGVQGLLHVVAMQFSGDGMLRNITPIQPYITLSIIVVSISFPLSLYNPNMTLKR